MHHNGNIPWYRSIRFRLVAAAVIIEICMLALLLGNSFRLISDALEQQTRGRLEALTPLLNASLSSGVFQQNYTGIQVVLDQLANTESADIRYLAVFDRKGQAFAAAGQVPLPAAVLDTSIEQALSDMVYDAEVNLMLSGESIGSVRFGLELKSMTARVKVVVASVMQPTVEYRYQPNASL